jgi:prepilin-type N-terminal cleavage/methylation domain-containing protein
MVGTKGRQGKGFTLIELLIVIVIISLLAALLLPALMKALCSSRQGAAASTISQVAQACKSYELDWAVFPPGKGSGSKDMVSYLSKKGAKQLAYFEFPPEQLDNGNLINPVFGAEGDPPSNWIHYRNNVAGQTGSNRPAPGSTGPGGAPYIHVNSFDIWCAGCDHSGSSPPPTSAYSVKYE